MKKLLFGSEIDRMPNFAFRILEQMMAVRDLLVPVSRKLDRLGIRQGDTVVDYGCGPGGYIPAVSRMVGHEGRVFAVDLHELAISSVLKKVKKHALSNVTTVLAGTYPIDIPNEAADIIYAFDMFHMVADHRALLHEFRRIIKPDGTLILEEGHQSQKEARNKIESTALWIIQKAEKGAFYCMPANV